MFGKKLKLKLNMKMNKLGPYYQNKLGDDILNNIRRNIRRTIRNIPFNLYDVIEGKISDKIWYKLGPDCWSELKFCGNLNGYING